MMLWRHGVANRKICLNKLISLSRIQISSFGSNFYTTEAYNPEFIEKIQLKNKISDSKPYTICVVGSGPAGFYIAKSILNNSNKIKVDIVDCNPHPFGLIRNGVAPDHQSMKKIQYDYDVVFQNPNCKFYGNVMVGEDISIKELLNSYTVVVLAYGASSDRELGIEGEHLLTSATDLINWYNGKIDYFKEFLDQKNFDFNKLKDISVIGNGNVATDLARIFLKDKKELENSDMPGPVIDIIKAPEINSVSLIGRRGVYQSAFSTKEIRELSKLDNLRIYMFDEDIKQSQNKESITEAAHGSSPNSRAISRRTQFLVDTCLVLENDDHYQEVLHDKSHKKLFLRYFLSPEKVLDSQNVIFSHTSLVGEPYRQKCVPSTPEKHVTIKSDLFLKSVGYKTIRMPGVPYDEDKFIVPNDKGAVIDEEGNMIKGLYVAGWAKRGPNGIIDATLRDSLETFRMIKSHIESNFLESKISSAEDTILKLNKNLVTYEDWVQVMIKEDKIGAIKGKPREKFLWKEDYERIICKGL